MEESDYWPRLEYRVSAEFAGFADRELRRYWCDGLVPDDYDLHGEVPCVRGRAWCGHSGQVPWAFILYLGRTGGSAPRTGGSAPGIEWAALLPDDRLTGWLTPDPTSKLLKIDPAAGHYP